MNNIKLNSVGKVRTIEKIYDSKNREVPIGTILNAYEHENCNWGYLVKFSYRKTLVGFYKKEYFELL